MKRHGSVFTPAAVATIHELARQGSSAAEIAAEIGSTPASVRVKCCHLKISLARGRPRSSQIGARQQQDQKLTLRIHPALYTALKRKSGEMQKSAGELAGLLLEAIINSDLYKAVLDDGA
jgi:hypothetical protein